MTEWNTPPTERTLHVPVQALPIRRDDRSSEEALSSGGVEPASCGNLTGMARDMCYASMHDVWY